ncbi:hypothetical protein [Rappaport israeli]|uniref:hypothetical protein n=1 Tax=Rappaport israeli TaxID=1839807 RepID=UPI0009311CF2|nr:hypothetical protein [Rappaport israeli]
MRKNLGFGFGFGLGLMLGLWGCAGGMEKQEALSPSLTASWLDGACHRYLEKQEIWQFAKKTLEAQDLAVSEVEAQVCACASRGAAENMTATQKLSLLSKASREKTLLDMVAPMALRCYEQFALR